MEGGDDGPSAAEPQPKESEYNLPQRRKGRKGGRKMVETICENIFPSPPNLAPLRLGGRISESENLKLPQYFSGML